MTVATDEVYSAIKASISSGSYAGGAHLRAADLADRFGVSRTPVREALRRLSAEGLVDFFAHRGAYVTRWTQTELGEVFALRTVLEGHAAEASATRLTPDMVAELGICTDGMERAAAIGGSRDFQSISAHNARFHSIVISAAANRRLAAMMSGVIEMPLVSRTFRTYSDQDFVRSLTHHRELIAAFTVRDAEWAGSVMRSHIRAAYHVVLSNDALIQG